MININVPPERPSSNIDTLLQLAVLFILTKVAGLLLLQIILCGVFFACRYL